MRLSKKTIGLPQPIRHPAVSLFAARVPTLLFSEALRVFRRLGATCFLTAVGVLFALPSPAGAVIVDCSQVGSQPAAVWPHPTRPELMAVLCQGDPLPGWLDSLWIIGTVPGAAPWIIEVPLHGTGVVRFSWLDCPGSVLAHVVDRTHMGTITDRVLRVHSGGRSGGRLQVVDSARLPPGTGSARTRVPCPSS